MKKDLSTMTEEELKNYEVPFPKTLEELNEIIIALTKREHDYGTCVYAMSIASVATFNYMSGALGSTGFQASCADLDILRRTRRMESGFQILNYDDLLYPQKKDSFNLIYEELIDKHKKRLSKEAKKLLKEYKDAHPDVIKHWKWLASLTKEEKQNGK